MDNKRLLVLFNLGSTESELRGERTFEDLARQGLVLLPSYWVTFRQVGMFKLCVKPRWPIANTEWLQVDGTWI